MSSAFRKRFQSAPPVKDLIRETTIAEIRAMVTGDFLFSGQPMFSLSGLSTSTYVLLGLVGVVILLVTGFLIFMVIVCLVERQYLIGDVEPASEPFPYPPTSYWKITRENARLLGLQHAGD